MKTVNIPFNIKLLNPEDNRFKQIRQIKSLETFEVGSENFHPEGLYSTEIFGLSGDDVRFKRFSFIDIKTKIFQPVYYKSLTEGIGLHEGIMSSKKYAIWDDNDKCFLESTPMNGETGYGFFMKYWKDIKFPETNSIQRQEQFKLLIDYKDKALTDKILVIPAGLRDLMIDDNGRYEEDDINVLYRRALAIANTINSSSSGNNVSDMARWKLQFTFNEIYQNLKSMIDGKKKLIRGKWASRNIVDGTRNVISPMDEGITKLDEVTNIGSNQTVIGLYQALKSARPVAVFEFKDKFLNKIDAKNNHNVLLINPKTLKQETIQLENEQYDLFFTDEGINKIFSLMKDEEMFHSTAMLNGYFLSLIYIGNKYLKDISKDVDNDLLTENLPSEKTVKLFSDIDELPDGFNKNDVRPATFAELIYLSVVNKINGLPIFITRYPIATLGSIYPSLSYVRTTVESEKRYVLNDEWNLDKNNYVPSFPIYGRRFVSTVNPNPIRLKGLGAD